MSRHLCAKLQSCVLTQFVQVLDVTPRHTRINFLFAVMFQSLIDYQYRGAGVWNEVLLTVARRSRLTHISCYVYKGDV